MSRKKFAKVNTTQTIDLSNNIGRLIIIYARKGEKWHERVKR